MKTSSKILKAKVLSAFRFHKRYLYCATEVGRYEADIMLANDKELVEIEIKISKVDLRNDLLKSKHSIYKNLESRHRQHIPNKFYFAVPPELTKEAIKLVKGTVYGVIEVSHQKPTRRRHGITIVLKAKTIHEYKNNKLKDKLLMRMGSELCRFHLKHLD